MSESRDTSPNTDDRGLLGRLRGSVRLSPAKRRWLLRLGVVVAVLIVLVAVPSYFALQPEFFDRYPAVDEQFETWKASTHAQVACQSCHVRPGPVPQVKHGFRMLGEFYLSRVIRSRQPNLLSKPTNAACSSCHIDLRTVSPSGDLNIPHRAHVDILKIPCVQCHAFLVHEFSPEGSHTPRMTACLECHDGEQAKNACTTCHTEKAAPKEHSLPDWTVVHAQKQNELDCEECHAWTDNWCVECHTRRPKSHVEKWRSEHGARIEVRRNCESCHEGGFCIECHGEVPALNFDPARVLVE